MVNDEDCPDHLDYYLCVCWQDYINRLEKAARDVITEWENIVEMEGGSDKPFVALYDVLKSKEI